MQDKLYYWLSIWENNMLIADIIINMGHGSSGYKVIKTSDSSIHIVEGVLFTDTIIDGNLVTARVYTNNGFILLGSQDDYTLDNTHFNNIQSENIQPYIKVGSSTTVTLTGASKVSFDTEVVKVDPNANYTLASSEVSVARAGHYELVTEISLQNETITNSPTEAGVWIELNGILLPYSKQHVFLRSHSDSRKGSVTIREIVNLSANDVVSVYVQKDSVGGDNVQSIGQECSLFIRKLEY